MRPIAIVLGGLACAVAALYWWVRRPPDRRDQVSDEWRDEHIRDRRE